MYRRSLFAYELLPVFRCAKIAKLSYDYVFGNGGMGFSEYTDGLRRCFDEVLINEGKSSELIGKNDRNFLSQKYFPPNSPFILDKKPILGLFEKFWRFNGVKIECKPEVRQEFSALARDIHPFGILSLYLLDRLKRGVIDECMFAKNADALDYVGISNIENSAVSENHMHLGGAYPSESCIFDCMNAVSGEVAGDYPPDADRDSPMFGTPREMLNIFGNCARYLFRKNISQNCAENTDSAADFNSEDKLLKKQIFSLGSLGNFLFVAFAPDSLELLRKQSNFSFGKDSRGSHSMFLLKKIAEYSRSKPNVAFFYFFAFLWENILYCADCSNRPAAFMLLHLANLLRSYTVMSACTGLEFFTSFFNSKVRKLRRDTMTQALECVVNSGVKNVQYRLSLWNPIGESIPKCVAEIEGQAAKSNSGDCDCGNFRATIVAHIAKTADKKAENFLEKDKRKKIENFCRSFSDFAGSKNSMCDKHELLLKYKIGNCAELLSKMQNGENPPERLDLMRYISGIDAAGNEECFPPEIFAPYLRELAEMKSAQKMRARSPTLPPLARLRKVFHAGEDFEDLVTGLRRIDETVKFLSYGKNDRLGHALALGVNPFEWYAKKGEIRTTKIVYLDNLVWLWFNAQNQNNLVAFRNKCAEEAMRVGRELYAPFVDESGSPEITMDNLYDAWLLRRNCPLKWESVENGKIAKLLEYAEDTGLIPDIRKKFRSEKDPDFCGKSAPRSAYSDCSDAAKLFHIYNYDCDFFNRANESVEIRFEKNPYYNPKDTRKTIAESDVGAIMAIQDLKIDEYAEAGIILEVCPSSNLYIGNFESIEKHPIFRWNPPILRWLDKKFNASGLRKNVIRVCVNTDDPAIFCTTLENEFMLLQYGAKNNMDDCDNIEEVDNWLRNLKNFNDEVFRQDWENARCVRA